MINNLQLDVRKEDYDALSKKLNISLEESSGIKYIEAEQIFREDKDLKKKAKKISDLTKDISEFLEKPMKSKKRYFIK